MRRRRVGTSHQQQLREIRAVVLGQDGVGKSALTVRFLTRRFIGEYDSCLEATHRHYLTVDGQFISLDITDTAGNNSKEKIESALLNANLIFLLYSTTSRESFQEASWISKSIQESKNLQPNTAIIIVATKSDLKHSRKVHEYEGLFLAQELESNFFQISISEGYKETQEVLIEGIRMCMNKELERGRSSTLSRVKEGLKGTAKSLRKKSSTDNFFDSRGNGFSSSTNV
ncbi:ras-related and estrogen-regulated growth inhibitor-like [Actinia tenebrosa]|uniref:small monomeric GTPase n=1 Tax=Actinia tenebrosa TaxID=6105 RepID=A0A6P8IVN7_ACTTE|nr:ras-related and estrogen-regulated growth inhibitor-like [Actinia tenebrosa]XP_031570193.1 ras-related and estrogen-regulated growth inhibitor-like [Actinia tenebrosa]XP_031570194.1 ras-related and estrogen-regulated growth inhibitor-like [Actinia tenebrosa]